MKALIEAASPVPVTEAVGAVQTAPAPPRDIYEELFELAPDAYLFTTPTGRIRHANHAASTLLNCPRASLVGAQMSGFLSASDHGRLVRDLPLGGPNAALPEHEVTLTPLHKPPVPVAVTLGVARDGTGRRYGVRWLVRDITERKRVEQRLQASLREKELLLREVYHRVKNNLQVVSSLLTLQEGALTDPAALHVLRAARDRIRSMALVHERLYRSRDVACVDFADYLRQLVRELRLSYSVPDCDVQVAFELSNVSLGIDVAIPCSMVVHELVSNALRHAFRDRRHGRIRLELSREVLGWCRLVVADDGPGLRAAEERPTGTLGLQLVGMLVEQLGGCMTQRTERGTEVTVRFPLQQTADASA
jgi:PAS domain S-box-containing protein